MQKTILLTGATDGIGLETAKMLVAEGHCVLVHGRSPEKLNRLMEQLSELPAGNMAESYVADLSSMTAVGALAAAVAEKHATLDVLINNAGVYHTPEPITVDGLDTRFAVNTIAPYLLTKRLLPLLGVEGRVVNLSSAAQAPLVSQALAQPSSLGTGMVYAQSKLALTMWNNALAASMKEGPVFVAVNPKSMLGSKMVKEAYGVNGADLRIGAEILCRAALSDEFATASGKYFDNDIGKFAMPHPDAMSADKCEDIVQAIESVLVQLDL